MKNLTDPEVNALRKNARALVRELGLLNDAYCEIGVTLAERHLLIELQLAPALTMGELSERLLLDKSTVSRLIGKAVKKGYIICLTDEKDKRKRLLQMTEHGRKILHTFEPIAFSQTKQALLTLTNEEIKTVYKGVALYAKGLRDSRLKTKLTLRPYESKDEDALYEIFQEVVDSRSQFPYESSSKETFLKHFFTPEGKVYVCTMDHKLIGGFYLKPNSSSHIANAAYMLKSSFRGKGVGKFLLKASLDFAKEQGFHAMQFNRVLSHNTRAVQLYTQLGFKIIHTLPNDFRNPDGSYQDSYVMYKDLYGNSI